jgi:transposase-like protein
MYSKEQKRAIGQEAYEKVDTLVNIARKYDTSYQNVVNWRRAYAKSLGMVTIKKENQGTYDSLSEAELREELMRKDIEIARLKKGYVVKGGGEKKVYDTIPD